MEAIVAEIMALVKKSGVVVPRGSVMELSHHYGLDRFREWGAAVITCFNRPDYSKKLLVMLPGQKHPEHYHVQKEETFTVLYGDLSVNDRGDPMKPGDWLVMERQGIHGFYTEHGCVFEEVATHHFENDSFYSNRKTKVREW